MARNDDPEYVMSLERALEAAELEIKGLEGELREQDKVLHQLHDQLSPTHMGEPLIVGADREENRLLRALLREWHGMFAPCRRDGTEGADLIDRTGLMLRLADMMTPQGKVGVGGTALEVHGTVYFKDNQQYRAQLRFPIADGAYELVKIETPDRTHPLFQAADDAATLHQRIRSAQIAAGEEAVTANLRSMGVLPNAKSEGAEPLLAKLPLD